MVSALAWKFLEGPRIGLGNFENFRREKPKMFRSCRNRRCCFSLIKITTPEMFRSCRYRFGCFSQMKITKPKLFRNALKIILVGTRNVLSPHKYFQFERTLKNVIMNSESAFWDIFGEPPFWTWSKF